MANRTRRILRAGEAVHCLTLDFPTASLAEFAGHLGYTALSVDLEHGTCSWADVENLVRACDVAGTDLIVKVPASGDVVDRCVDAGVHGLHLTHTEDVESVRRIVGRLRFAPDGQRGIARSRSTRFGHFPGGYQALAAADLPFLMVTVESTRGIESLPALLQEPDIDAVFVGAFDLSADMGLLGQQAGPLVRQHIADEVMAPALAAGKTVGISASSREDSADAIARGGRFLLASQARLLSGAAKTQLEATYRTEVSA
jgi:2-keto-3-deoxy-L-rhamnonate aldolase RhmA